MMSISGGLDLTTLGKLVAAAVAAFGVAKLLFPPSRMEPEDLEPLPEPPAGSTFITLPVSNVKLRYADTGAQKSSVLRRILHSKRDDVTFVLLHGFAGVLETWNFLVPELQKKNPNFRVLSLDLVGSGFSDKPVGDGFDYSYRSQGKIVVEFLSQLDLSRVVLVGHSSGTVVAAAAALECPSRVIGTVFVANALFRAKSSLFSNPWLKSFFGWMATKMTADRKKSLSRMHHPMHIDKILTDEFVQLFAAPTRLPNFHAALVETVVAKEAPYEDLINALMLGPETSSSSSSSSFSPVPMLFVYGKDDTYKPLPVEQAASLQGKLDGMDPKLRNQQKIETVSLEDCAHYAQHEQPEALADAIREFLHKHA